MGSILRSSAMLMAILFMTGCVSTRPPQNRHNQPPPESLSNKTPILPTAGANEERTSLTGTVTFPEVMDAVLNRHPALEALRLEKQARQHAAEQAGLWENPRLGAEYEDFAGSGELSGTDAAETTLTMSQEIPLAGKARKRRKVADLEAELTDWDLRLEALDLLAEAHLAFAHVVAAQQRLDLAEESVELVERLAQGVEQRVEAGDVSPVERTRAQVELSTARIQQRRAQGALDEARTRLASLWGEEEAEFERVQPDAPSLPELPAFAVLRQRLSTHPGLQRFDHEKQLQEAKLTLAEAEAWPDLEVGGGFRQYNENGEHAFLVEVGIPLPFWNRNQGGIAEANTRSAQVTANRQAVERKLSTELQALTVSARAQQTVVKELRDDLLPKSKATYDAVKTAYETGQKDLLDLLDSERTYLQTREALTESNNELRNLHAELAGLLGMSISELNHSSRETN